MTKHLPRLWFSAADASAMVGAALRTAFPGIEFDVQLRQHGDAAHIDVTWTGGPTADAVRRVTRCYEGMLPDPLTGRLRPGMTLMADADGEALWLAHYGVDSIAEHRAAPVEPYPATVERRTRSRRKSGP